MADPSGAAAEPRKDAPMSNADRAAALVQLKNFAVAKGYGVPADVITGINTLQQAGPEIDPSKVDEFTVALTQITYPVTIYNVDHVGRQAGVTWFVYALLLVGLAAATISGILSWDPPGSPGSALPYAKPLAALCLGVVGAIVYVMLPNGRLNTVVGLDAESVADTIVRIAMGGLLGYVLYIAGTSMMNQQPTDKVNWILLLPLLGGYSITLVVGILSKAVAAFQLTFNIDEKSVRALQK